MIGKVKVGQQKDRLKKEPRQRNLHLLDWHQRNV